MGSVGGIGSVSGLTGEGSDNVGPRTPPSCNAILSVPIGASSNVNVNLKNRAVIREV